jgi:hypothetical protein
MICTGTICSGLARLLTLYRTTGFGSLVGDSRYLVRWTYASDRPSKLSKTLTYRQMSARKLGDRAQGRGLLTAVSDGPKMLI